MYQRACLTTLPNFGSFVAAPHDLGVLAIARHGEVKLLNTITYAECRNFQHSEVRAIALPNVSKTLATISRDGLIKVWNVYSGKCLTTFTASIAHEDISCIALSPNGGLLASASKHMWWRRDGQQHRATDSSLVKKPGTIKIWNISSQSALVMLHGANEGDDFFAVAFSPDSKQLASASTYYVQIWDVSDGTCQKILWEHTNAIGSVVFAPDSTLLASASYDGTMKIWDLNTSVYVRTLSHETINLHSIVFSPNSKHLASATTDGKIKLWDVSNGTCLQAFEGPTVSLTSMAFLNESQLVTASSDCTVKVWDATLVSAETDAEGMRRTDRLDAMALSHDLAWLAISSKNHGIEIWRCADRTCIGTLRELRGQTTHLIWISATRLVVGLELDHIRIWEINQMGSACLRRFRIRNCYLREMSISHDSSKLAVRSGPYWDRRTLPNYIDLWALEGGHCIFMLESDHYNETPDLSFSLDDAWLHTSYCSISTSPPYSVECDLESENDSSQTIETVGYSSDETWITYAGRLVLWVPPEFRPAFDSASLGPGQPAIWIPSSQHSVKSWLVYPCGQTMVTLTVSGRLWFIAFDASQRPDMNLWSGHDTSSIVGSIVPSDTDWQADEWMDREVE